MELTIEENILLNKLTTISKTILVLYQLMFESKKNSTEFMNQEDLNEALIIEETYYINLLNNKKTIDQLIIYIEFIKENTNINQQLYNENLTILRIYNKLLDIRLTINYEKARYTRKEKEHVERYIDFDYCVIQELQHRYTAYTIQNQSIFEALKKLNLITKSNNDDEIISQKYVISYVTPAIEPIALAYDFEDLVYPEALKYLDSLMVDDDFQILQKENNLREALHSLEAISDDKTTKIDYSKCKAMLLSIIERSDLDIMLELQDIINYMINKNTTNKRKLYNISSLINKKVKKKIKTIVNN